jgi:signal peptidase II
VLLAGTVVVADQLSKAWIDGSFPLAWTNRAVPGLAAPTPVIGDLVRIAKTYNDGGLFGLFDAAAPILAVASLVVVGLIVLYQARAGLRSWPLTLALGLLLGGAIGNLADRLRLGYVIDFVDMGLGDLRWYTFNVADAAISVSILLLIVLSLVGDRLERSRRPARTMAAGGPAASPGSGH